MLCKNLKMMDDDDDTHLCLRCSLTVKGLDNYVTHRKQHCMGFRPDQTSSHQTAACPITTSNSVSQCIQQTLETAEPRDLFFSSLELQSKPNIPVSCSVTGGNGNVFDVEEVSSVTKPSQLDVNCDLLADDLQKQQIPSDGEELDISDDDDSEDGYYPPRSHTGGKWKPGTRPDLSSSDHWRSLPSPVQNTNEACHVDFHLDVMSGISEIDEGTSEIACHTCKRIYKDKHTYSRHLYTAYHLKRADRNKSAALVSLEKRRACSLVRTECKEIEKFTCLTCSIDFSNSFDIALHKLSQRHRDKFHSFEDWYRDVVEFQKTMTMTVPYRCLICSYYFSRSEDFEGHMRNKSHCQKAAQLRRPLYCSACQFECRGSDEMMAHITSEEHESISKFILPFHPVTIMEKTSRNICDVCPKECVLPSVRERKEILSMQKFQDMGAEFPGSFLDEQEKEKTLPEGRSQRVRKKTARFNSDSPFWKQALQRRTVKCSYCQQVFQKIYKWKSHVLANHSDKCHKCLSCNTSYATVTELKKHKRKKCHLKKTNELNDDMQPDEGTFMANTSGGNSNGESSSPLQNILQEDVATEMVSETFVEDTTSNCTDKQEVMVEKVYCSQCKKYFSKLQYRYHMKIHSGEKPFQCSICDKRFPYKSRLTTHMKSHLALKKFKCDYCNYSTTHKSILHRHLASHQKSSSKPFLCDTCGASHPSKSALKNHMRIHSDKEFKCTVPGCHKVYKTKSDLQYHVRVHNNDRPYLCDICGYAGTSSHQLKKHQRCHTGEKPFKCKYCDYSAARSSQIFRHMRLHTGSKPYKCPYCKYCCNTQENMRKHILKTKKHSGKKMYSCQYCEYGCNEFQNYREHLITIHSEHFPKGEKDVESSVIAGLYIKDTLPKSSQSSTSSKEALQQAKGAEKKNELGKSATKPVAAEEPAKADENNESVVYISIPEMPAMNSLDSSLQSSQSLDDFTSNAINSLANMSQDPNVMLLTEGGSEAITSEDFGNTRILISSDLGGSFSDHLGNSSSFGSLAQATGLDGNAVYVYLPVS